MRAHVIVTHDLHSRVGQVIDLFSAANRVDKVMLEEVTRSLLDDILRDCEILVNDLARIERWARRQRKKLPTSLREQSDQTFRDLVEEDAGE